MRLVRCGQRIRQRKIGRGISSRRELRQSEIENLGVATFGNKDIGWLDVTMHDPLRVCGIEGVRNFQA